jgi:hypothetical protein
MTPLEAIIVCMFCPPCTGPVCTFACYQVPCESSKGPPVGCHSHSTHYTPTYSPDELRFNQTRADVRDWLRGVV